MSTSTSTKTSDQRVHELEQQNATMQAQLSRQQELLTSQHRTKLRERIAVLFSTGRCTGDWRDAALTEVAQHQMSVDSAPSRLEDRITDRESLPEGAVWSADERVTQLSLADDFATVPAVSNKFRGNYEPTDEEVDNYAKTAAAL
jgi:hypothetical protein